RCVVRDRRQRIGDIAAALFVLSDPTFGTVTAGVLPTAAAEPPRWRRVVPLAVGIALGALITSAAWWTVREPTVHRTVTRLSLRPPEGQRLLSSTRRIVALSADGTK